MHPTPLTEQQIQHANDGDKFRAVNAVPPIETALTLEDAVARALKYNLNHRIAIFEAALAGAQFEASQFDMLPSLLANAGYSWRDNDNTRSSSSLEPLPSVERSRLTTDITFYWNLLDFGLGYFTSKENADRALIAVEKRRRAMNALIRDVETAYWRAAAAQALEAEVQQTLSEAESALQRSRIIVQSRLQPLNEALAYQRNLLENIRLLESVIEELQLSQSELLGLIGALPNEKVRLRPPAELKPAEIAAPVAIIEQLTMLQNPDLRIEHYAARVAVLETQRALWEYVPNLSFNFGGNYDSDTYLVNKQWFSAGLSVSHNLLSLLGAPSRMDVARKGVELAEMKRMALQMTLLTQLHLALQQYGHAKRQFDRASEIYEVDRMIAQSTAQFAQQEMASDLDRISSRVTSILSEVRRYHAFAKVKEAEIRIQSTVGLEPKIGNLDQTPLPALVQLLREDLRSDQLFAKPLRPGDLLPLEIAQQDPAGKRVSQWIELDKFQYRDNALSAVKDLVEYFERDAEWHALGLELIVRAERGAFLLQAGPVAPDLLGDARSVLEYRFNKQLSVRDYINP